MANNSIETDGRFEKPIKHVHGYSGMTNLNYGHKHRYMGVTGPVYYKGSRYHCHEIMGMTTCDDGHYHAYRGRTGPAMEAEGGRHVHHYRFETNFADKHTHIMEGYVMPLEYEGYEYEGPMRSNRGKRSIIFKRKKPAKGR